MRSEAERVRLTTSCRDADAIPNVPDAGTVGADREPGVVARSLPRAVLDVLLVDVQGAETALLEGARSFLTDRVR
jgi:hypothetical protein